MPDIIPVTFAPGSNEGREGQDGLARILNAYAEQTPGGKTPVAYYAREGLRLYDDLGVRGPMRGEP